MGNLTVVQVKNQSKPGRYGDGDGLWLQVSKWGTKSWILRFWRDGKERQLGLGPVDLVSLAEARDRARDARRLLLDNIDPIDNRRELRAAKRLETAKQMTFAQCVEAYIQAHSAAWRNPKHRDQWQATLTDDYCKPILNLPVRDIDTDLVLRVLIPQWQERTITAKRVRGRIERVLSWAKGRNLRTGENPARWNGHLSEMLASPSKLAPVENHAAMAYADLPGFMEELRARDGAGARALEFLVLTGARTGEILGAKWDEISAEDKTWTIPGSRMKGGKQHRVPLCDRSLDILEHLPREKGNPFMFVGNAAGGAIGKMVMWKLLREMRPGLTAHGFRASFRTWAAERTNFPREICEAALAHTVGSDVELRYQRGDLFEKRRQLMKSWAAYCSKPKTAAGNVVKLRA